MHIQDNRFKSNQREKVLKNKKSNRQPDTEQTKPELKGVSDNDKLTLKQQIIDSVCLSVCVCVCVCVRLCVARSVSQSCSGSVCRSVC